MICHKIGVAIQNIKIPPLCPLFKIGRNIIIPRKNHKNYSYRFDRGITLIHPKYIEVSCDLTITLYKVPTVYFSVST